MLLFDETPERNKLKEEGIILAHSFRGFSTCFAACIGQGIIAVGGCGGSCLPLGGQGAESKRGQG